MRKSIPDTIAEIMSFEFHSAAEAEEPDSEATSPDVIEEGRYSRRFQKEMSVLSDKSDITLDVSSSSDVFYDAHEDPLSR